MLHGRECWCWPDSTFSCESKIYKQANYANHFLGMNSEQGELASSATFKLQLTLPDPSVATAQTPRSMEGLFAKSCAGSAVGLPFRSVLLQWAIISTQAHAIFQPPQRLSTISAHRESLPTSFWPTWQGWKECGQEREAPCCQDKKLNVTAILAATHGERGTTASQVKQSL